MDSQNNMFGEYGERFWEDVMSTSTDFPDLAETVEVSSAAEGVDILQQSLRQAKILDVNEEPDSLDFKDFGLIDSGLSNSTNVFSDYKQLFDSDHSLSVGVKCNQSVNTKVQQDDVQSLFNVSDFLNITTAVTQAVSTTAVRNPAASTSTLPIANVTFTTYPNTVIHHQPSNLQPVTRNQSGFQSQTFNSSIPTNTGAFVVQLPNTNQAVNENSASKYVVSHQSAQYVVASVQPNSCFVNVSLSSSLQLPVTVQSRPVAVCNSTFTTTVSHPIATPVIFSSKISNSQVVPTSTTLMSTAQTQPLVNRIQAPVVLQQKQIAPTHDEQTNKLAFLLQNRAVNYPGVGKILKVGSQNINITNIDVAKALASRILQQKLSQDKQNQVAIVTPSTETKTVSHNVTVVNIPACGLKNAVGVSLPQQLHSQIPNASLDQCQSIGITQVNIVPQVKNLPLQVQSISPSITVSIKPSQVTQVTKRDSSTPSPQNRFQIASVNISRPSSQPNMSSTIAQQRIKSPFAISFNAQQVTTTAKLNNSIRKVIPIQTVPSSSTTTTASTLIEYQGATIKLNLTPQQANNLTPEQLQKIVMQHQATLNSKKALPAAQQPTQSNGTLSGGVFQTKAVQLSHGALSDKTKVVTFRVDPNLTSQQIDEVQQIILKKVPLNKVQQLTTEQKQLLSAFRAQLRTMEPGIQQYYLRNPHLFLQKVFQHIQSGKPFLFQVKVDPLKSAAAPAASAASKAVLHGGNHPTITLSADGNRQRVTKASVVSAPASVVSTLTSISNSPKPVLRVPTSLRASLPQQGPTPLQVPVPLRAPVPLRVSAPFKRTTSPIVVSTSRKLRRTANVVADNSVMEALPAKRPSLLLEQLQKHRELVAAPNILPFRSVRDAYRRLLPFHVLNMPEIKQASFDEAESMFDVISESATCKLAKMLKKYHLLCLKDASMETCSADSVMLDRIFLQHEKAALAETKQAVNDDPDILFSYLPSSYEKDYPIISSMWKAKEEARQVTIRCANTAGYHHSAFDLSQEPQLAALASNHNADKTNEDMLLQEAVESILS